MHLSVGTDDAANTAILYGVIVQSVSYLIHFVEANFADIERRDGAILVEPDYVSGKTHADIDIVCSMNLGRALMVLLGMLSAYSNEQDRTFRKAALRINKKRGKAA